MSISIGLFVVIIYHGPMNVNRVHVLGVLRLTWCGMGAL